MESRKRSGAISLMAVMGGEGSEPERISKLCRWQLSEVQTRPRAEWCEILRERGGVRSISRRCLRTAHQHSNTVLNLFNRLPFSPRCDWVLPDGHQQTQLRSAPALWDRNEAAARANLDFVRSEPG